MLHPKIEAIKLLLANYLHKFEEQHVLISNQNDIIDALAIRVENLESKLLSVTKENQKLNQYVAIEIQEFGKENDESDSELKEIEMHRMEIVDLMLKKNIVVISVNIKRKEAEIWNEYRKQYRFKMDLP